MGLVPQLLLIHPYFDGVEPSVQDGEYICKVNIIIFYAFLLFKDKNLGYTKVVFFHIILQLSRSLSDDSECA